MDAVTTRLPPAVTADRRSGIDSASVIAFCIMFALASIPSEILHDGDTLWQIRTGEWILNHHAIPRIDPFSYTAGTRPWYPHEWLAEVVLSLAYRAAGFNGVIFLAATSIGLTAAIMLRHLRRFLPAPYAFAALAVGLSCTAPSMLARPHLLAWPCLAAICSSLAMARSRQTAPSFWLLPVMVLWVNLHGSFMVGLLLPIGLMIEALFDPRADRRRVLTGWGGFIVAEWICALINPATLEGLLFPFRMLRMSSTQWIGEWLPVDFDHAQPVEFIILGGLVLGLLGKLRLPPFRLLILLGLILETLMHRRNQQLLGIVGTLTLIEPFAAGLGLRPSGEMGRAGWVGASVAVAIACVAVPVRLKRPISPDYDAKTVADVLATVPDSTRALPVLNDYGVGGDLIFLGIHPYIDSRADLYGDAFLSKYREMMGDRTVLMEVLEANHVGWTIFPDAQAVASILDGVPGWKRLETKDGYAIHVRSRS
jgi:hypothetical protein